MRFVRRLVRRGLGGESGEGTKSDRGGDKLFFKQKPGFAEIQPATAEEGGGAAKCQHICFQYSQNPRTLENMNMLRDCDFLTFRRNTKKRMFRGTGLKVLFYIYCYNLYFKIDSVKKLCKYIPNHKLGFFSTATYLFPLSIYHSCPLI